METPKAAQAAAASQDDGAAQAAAVADPTPTPGEGELEATLAAKEKELQKARKGEAKHRIRTREAEARAAELEAKLTENDKAPSEADAKLEAAQAATAQAEKERDLIRQVAPLATRFGLPLDRALEACMAKGAYIDTPEDLEDTLDAAGKTFAADMAQAGWVRGADGAVLPADTPGSQETVPPREPATTETTGVKPTPSTRAQIETALETAWAEYEALLKSNASGAEQKLKYRAYANVEAQVRQQKGGIAIHEAWKRSRFHGR